MKKLIFTLALATLGFACNSAPAVQQNTSTAATPAGEKPQTAVAHSTDDKTQEVVTPATGGKSKWTQGGDPVDTQKFDSAIAMAEKAAGANPSDEKTRKVLATAYFDRAVALTEARQYASALGDYRRAFKYDPSNTEAKGWIDKIIMIYDGMGKSYPKEGEEPPPLGKKE